MDSLTRQVLDLSQRWQLAEHEKMFFIRRSGQVHFVVFGGAVECGTKIRLLFPGLGKINFDRTMFVELPQIAEDF